MYPVFLWWINVRYDEEICLISLSWTMNLCVGLCVWEREERWRAWVPCVRVTERERLVCVYICVFAWEQFNLRIYEGAWVLFVYFFDQCPLKKYASLSLCVTQREIGLRLWIILKDSKFCMCISLINVRYEWWRNMRALLFHGHWATYQYFFFIYLNIIIRWAFAFYLDFFILLYMQKGFLRIDSIPRKFNVQLWNFFFFFLKAKIILVVTIIDYGMAKKPSSGRLFVKRVISISFNF